MKIIFKYTIILLFTLLISINNNTNSFKNVYKINKVFYSSGLKCDRVDIYCSEYENDKYEYKFPKSSTPFSKEKFVNRVVNFFDNNPTQYAGNTYNCHNVFDSTNKNNREIIGTIYDSSLKYGLNPEVTIVKAVSEGSTW